MSKYYPTSAWPSFLCHLPHCNHPKPATSNKQAVVQTLVFHPEIFSMKYTFLRRCNKRLREVNSLYSQVNCQKVLHIAKKNKINKNKKQNKKLPRNQARCSNESNCSDSKPNLTLGPASQVLLIC